MSSKKMPKEWKLIILFYKNVLRMVKIEYNLIPDTYIMVNGYTIYL